MTSRRPALIAALALAFATPLPAQISMGSMGRYDMLYGPPVEVPLEDVASGMGYNRRAVITTGALDALDFNGRYYRLRDAGAEVLVIPVPDAHDDLRRLMGREIEVTGLAREVPHQQNYNPGCGLDSQCADPELPPLPSLNDAGHMNWPRVSITVWSFADLTPTGKEKKREFRRATLEDLVMSPGKSDGKTLRVVGQFRGKNLYGDLPARSQLQSGDWVIKDDAFAVWVTGKKPKGSGWELDAGLKRDTGRWIEVVGRVATRNGITYLRAVQVALTTPPTPTARAEAPPPPPERPKVPPVVVFALPLDGDDEVTSDSRFVVQFSKDMDETSFQGRILLRYVGPVRAGDRAFDAVRLTYDPGRRALTVDPGDELRPGRQVELLLLPGIKDTDGLELIPRPGHTVEAGVDRLRYLIGS